MFRDPVHRAAYLPSGLCERMNLKQLEAQREKASEDKADLFDFYHDNWDALVAEITRLRREEQARDDNPVQTFFRD